MCTWTSQAEQIGKVRAYVSCLLHALSFLVAASDFMMDAAAGCFILQSQEPSVQHLRLLHACFPIGPLEDAVDLTDMSVARTLPFDIHAPY